MRKRTAGRVKRGGGGKLNRTKRKEALLSASINPEVDGLAKDRGEKRYERRGGNL